MRENKERKKGKTERLWNRQEENTHINHTYAHSHARKHTGGGGAAVSYKRIQLAKGTNEHFEV